MHLITGPLSKVNQQRRMRTISGGEFGAMVVFPRYGAWVAGRELIKMATSLELMGNETADGFDKMSVELVALRTTVMQNRVALDMIPAEKGGTCVVISKECCTYIPDNSEKIHDRVNYIRKEASKYNNYAASSESIGSWLKGIFGGWGGTILRLLITILFIIVVAFILLMLFKVIVQKAIGKCFSGWTTKPSTQLVQTEMVPVNSVVLPPSLPLPIITPIPPIPALCTPPPSPIPIEPNEMYCELDVAVDQLLQLTLDKCLELLTPMEGKARNTMKRFPCWQMLGFVPSSYFYSGL
uniref:Uncharacterized protein n=1 Tax=Eptatretus burgeri TaxID=7764 RepID=A0A8C4PW96_EPTBU